MKYPQRNPQSHKGQNGKVVCIGGNTHYHGAPILAALGAEASGCDLIFLLVPKKHAPVARMASKNFIVYEFEKDYFSPADLPFLLDFSSRMADSFVIGNGLGNEPESQKAVINFLKNTSLRGVVDAEGLIPEIIGLNDDLVITPHDLEFEKVFNVKSNRENVQKMAREHKLTILKTGVNDWIASPYKYVEHKMGCPKMTVGGTGDALSGIVAGLMAQKQSSFKSAKLASYFWSKTGDALSAEKSNFTAEEMCFRFPYITQNE